MQDLTPRYVERIAKGSTDAGQKLSGFPTDSNPVEAWSLGTANTLVTTAHEINVFKTNPAGLLSGPAPLSLLAQTRTTKRVRS